MLLLNQAGVQRNLLHIRRGLHRSDWQRLNLQQASKYSGTPWEFWSSPLTSGSGGTCVDITLPVTNAM